MSWSQGLHQTRFFRILSKSSEQFLQDALKHRHSFLVSSNLQGGFLKMSDSGQKSNFRVKNHLFGSAIGHFYFFRMKNVIFLPFMRISEDNNAKPTCTRNTIRHRQKRDHMRVLVSVFVRFIGRARLKFQRFDPTEMANVPFFV